MLKKRGIILKVIMNVSLSLNNFDWEAVDFFFIFPIIISISVCMTSVMYKKSFPFPHAQAQIPTIRLDENQLKEILHDFQSLKSQERSWSISIFEIGALLLQQVTTGMQDYGICTHMSRPPLPFAETSREKFTKSRYQQKQR